MASSASDFRRHKEGEDLTLPSGLRCKARRVGMQVLLREGVIPNSLMPIVQEALQTGQRGQDWDPSKLLADLTDERIKDYMAAMDNVVCAIVVEPKILPVPERCTSCGKLASDHPEKHEGVAWEPVPDDERDQELAYIDWVDEFDKSFLVAYATGGTADAEKFRKQYTEHLGSLQSGQGIQDTPKRPARRR